MRRRGFAALQLVAVAVGSLVSAPPVMAYVGPGAGLTVIGSVLALLGALVLAVVGFIWYPLRRLRRKRKAAAQKPAR